MPREEVRPWAGLLADAATAAAVAVVAVVAAPDQFVTLSVVLLIATVMAGTLVAGASGGLGISASFLVTTLAAVFLGPRSAIVLAVFAELAAAIRLRTEPRFVLLANVPICVIPAIIAALISRVLGGPSTGADFYIGVILAAVASIVIGYVLFAGLRRLVFPSLEQFGLRAFLDYLPTAALNVALVAAGAAIKVKLGNAGIAFALSAVLTFSYMAHLLDRSRRRAQQYVSLSWGVLAGLLRALDTRDGRACRHAAAVAHFARDVAQAVGMSEAECELAHTAGLLHDIGRFALSDRVAERGRALTEEDWTAIQRHPELGADLLRDLGMYGPVGEIVLCHHERIDGLGYPRRLAGEEIPAIARIVAVAEVYDTLTASDTYRTPMSSFEALRELRRVAGTQLDARYIEVLADLLKGEDLTYRHADAADFDRELDMERRLGQVAAGG